MGLHPLGIVRSLANGAGQLAQAVPTALSDVLFFAPARAAARASGSAATLARCTAATAHQVAVLAGRFSVRGADGWSAQGQDDRTVPGPRVTRSPGARSPEPAPPVVIEPFGAETLGDDLPSPERVGGPGDAAEPVSPEPGPRRVEESAEQPSVEALDAGAPGAAHDEVVELRDRVAEAGTEPEAPQSSVELPVDRWDERSPASLRPTLRTLSVEDLLVLLDWELEHAHRLQVITMLENRLAKLARQNAEAVDQQDSGDNAAPREGADTGRRDAVPARDTASPPPGTEGPLE